MRSTPSKKKFGRVSLVGAGPGDPGLLTLKASRRLSEADIVFFDHLVNPALLAFCPQAIRRDVGKRGYHEAFPQEKIARLLVEAARRHARVVRLKGGDPFIFGRGGEEAEALAKAGVPFEVVPGVSSAIAVPAYAGIPLTHRSHASSVTFLTGHGGAKPKGRGRNEAPPLDWDSLARQPTLVFLMGVKTMERNFAELIRRGRDPATPAALIEWGTYPRQRSLLGTLKTLPALARRRKFGPPAIAVVGAVAALRERLHWFEDLPLFGRRVVVTRGASQASQLSRALEEWGAEALELPMLEIRAPRSFAALDRAIARMESYDALLFSSVHGVEFFLRRFRAKKIPQARLDGLFLAAVGPATAEAMEAAGLRVNRVAETFTSEGLARGFKAAEWKGKRLLFPRAEQAEEAGVELLRRRGISVETVSAYRSVAPLVSNRRLTELFGAGIPDLLSFASGASVRNFVSRLRRSPYWKGLLKVPAAVIGPVTRRAAREAGLRVVAMPKRHTIPDLAQSIRDYFKG